MKRAKIIAAVSGIVVTGVGIVFFLLMPKEKIELTADGNNISWVNKSNKSTLGGKYYIYNDEFLVNKVTDESYFLTKEKLIDEVGPNKIDKAAINYGDKFVTISWEDVEDLGNDNKISVELYNEKERKVSYSNSVNVNFASGVKKYIVEFNGEEFEIFDNAFEIKKSALSYGITIVKVYAVDNRGNRGAVSSIPIYNYKIILSKEDDQLRYHIDDTTQNYTYRAIINGIDKGVIANSNELNELLLDDKAPLTIKNVEFNFVDKKVNANWKEVLDNGNDYIVRVEASGNSYFNSAYSDDMKIEKKSGVKGYYYAINKSSKYTVTNKDSFTDKSDIDFNSEYGDYYLHVASVDNLDNISKTTSHKFTVKDPSMVEEDKGTNTNTNEGTSSNNGNLNSDISTGGGNLNDSSGDFNKDSNENLEPENVKNKEEMIKNILVKNGSVSSSNYNKAVNIINKLPYSIIKSIYKENAKIYITSGEAEDLCKELTGKKIDSITGVFLYGTGELIVISEVSYMDSSLLHEIGHMVDYILGGNNFKSSTSEFNKIYSEEKDTLLTDEYSKGSVYEYFAESFVMYYNNNYKLRVKSPKTYSYIKKLLT